MKILPVVFAPERYLVREDGEVFSLINNQSNPRPEPRLVRPFINKDGYKMINLRLVKGGATKSYTVHKIVCSTFHGLIPSKKHECAHSDGDKTNNHFTNLRWVTHKENISDRTKHGRTVWGDRINTAKLTEDSVRAILLLRKNGFSVESISKMFDVSGVSVYKIISGKSWVRITKPDKGKEKKEGNFVSEWSRVIRNL